jgi:hypothetical protein
MRCMQFDTQDQAALRALDDFTISADGETALDVRIAHTQLLQQLGIEAGP